MVQRGWVKIGEGGGRGRGGRGTGGRGKGSMIWDGMGERGGRPATSRVSTKTHFKGRLLVFLKVCRRITFQERS